MIDDGFKSLIQDIRALHLIAAAHNAGLCPIRGNRLHVLAYLSNLLAPVWGLNPLEGKLLKLADGPYYPELQISLDRLIGIGLIEVSEVLYTRTTDNNFIPNGFYQPIWSRFNPILSLINDWSDEANSYAFLKEVAFAVSALPEHFIEKTSSEDATYVDGSIDFGNVIDFSEWRTKNFSANAANSLSTISNYHPDNAEKLHFYVNHLYSRINNE